MSRLGLTLDGRRRHDMATRPPPAPYVLATYNRERLYEEVWLEPTQTVAKKYGVSDVALSKVCGQLQIPKPPTGYWANKQAGSRSHHEPQRPRGWTSSLTAKPLGWVHPACAVAHHNTRLSMNVQRFF